MVWVVRQSLQFDRVFGSLSGLVVVFILRLDNTIPERQRGGTKYAGDVVTKAVGAVRWVKRAIRKHL